MEAKRNDPCPCGSGKKYKKCHGQIQAEMKRTKRSFSIPGNTEHPIISLTNKMIKVIETEGKDAPPFPGRPPSTASSEEAENPNLQPPKMTK